MEIRGCVSRLVAAVLVLVTAGCTSAGAGGEVTAAPSSAAPSSAAPSSAEPSSAASVPSGTGPLLDGTPNWGLSRPGSEHAIEGFADRVSVVPGEPVRLFVSTPAAGFTVTAFRFGAYQGSDARAVWTSAHQAGGVQPAPVVTGGEHTVTAPWHASLTVDTLDWAPGDYLFRLDGVDGAQRFVPLTVRTPSNAGRVVVINAVTTWQAYNQWGGYSLYKGPDGKRSSRSRAVAFDRPYDAGMQGAGQFLQFELGFLRVAERAGVPLGYATDTDLDADPRLLDGASAVITLGHDEYWTAAMRTAATAARDRGVNLAFLGGNEVYRHMRFASTGLGERRLEINYKSFREDPVSRTNPEDATQDWRQPPDPRPESVLVGGYYSCFPGRADLVATNPDNWLVTGIVARGEHLPGVVGVEYAKVDLSVPTPRPIEVLFHSPVVCGATQRHEFSDVTYYTTPGGAGVFSSGTQDWVCGMDPTCKGSGLDGRVGQVLDAITTRLLQAFAIGPAGRTHPAVDNLASLHIGSAR